MTGPMSYPCSKCRGFMYARPEGAYRCLCGHEKPSVELKAEYLDRCKKRDTKESLTPPASPSSAPAPAGDPASPPTAAV